MDFVKDWNGFEDLIAELNNNGDSPIKIEKDVELVGKSGAKRQIDILLTQKSGIYENKIIIECKYWNKNVTRLHIDAMAFALEDLNAAKGVFFTTKGFQKGAKQVAKYMGIELFKIRELSEQEWGNPGKIVDFYIQYYSRSIKNVQMMFLGQPMVLNNIQIGKSETKINHKLNSFNEDTVEGLIEASSAKTLKLFVDKNTFTFNNGEERAFYIVYTVNLDFIEPAKICLDDSEHLVIKITYDLGIKIDQKRMLINRAERYSHILIVENCVTKTIYYSSKKNEDTKSLLKQIENKLDQKNEENNKDTFENGSILKITLNNWFDAKEMEDLKEVDFSDKFKI